MGSPSDASLLAVTKKLQNDNLKDVTIKRNHFSSLLPIKKAGGDSNGADIALRIGRPRGIGPTVALATTLALTGGSTFKKMNITTKNMYGEAHLTGDEILDTNDDMKAYANLVRLERDGILEEMAFRLEHYFFRDGLAVLGQVASTTGKTITLEASDDPWMFSVNMAIVASATRSGGSLRTESTNGSRLVGVNRKTRVLTFENNVNDATDGVATSGVTTGDYLFPRGFYSTDDAPTVVYGLASIIPTTAPSSGETFYGIDRSANSELFGYHIDAATANLTFLETFYDLEEQVHLAGGDVTTYLVHPRTYNNIKKEMHGTALYELPVKVKNTNISFNALEFTGLSGKPVMIVPTGACPLDRIYALDMSCWHVKSKNKQLVTVTNFDKLDWLRVTDADSVAMRVDSRCNLVCTKPGYNAVATIAVS